MADHNGDFSPEAEHRRKMKREKVQRSRIRKKIEDARATALEIAAIEAWDNGEEWTMGETAQGYTIPAQDGAETAQPSAPRVRKVAQPSAPRVRKVAQGEDKKESGWGLWVAGGSVAAFLAAMLWAGLRGK